jgi:hypothetical protein
MAKQLMDNLPFEIPSLDHPANNLYAYISVIGGCTVGRKRSSLHLHGAEISERVVRDRHNREALVDFLRKTGDSVVGRRRERRR